MHTGVYKHSKPKTSNHSFSCYTSLKFKRTTVLRSHNSGFNDSKMAPMISTMAQNFLCPLAAPQFTGVTRFEVVVVKVVVVVAAAGAGAAAEKLT